MKLLGKILIAAAIGGGTYYLLTRKNGDLKVSRKPKSNNLADNLIATSSKRHVYYMGRTVANTYFFCGVDDSVEVLTCAVKVLNLTRIGLEVHRPGSKDEYLIITPDQREAHGIGYTEQQAKAFTAKYRQQAVI